MCIRRFVFAAFLLQLQSGSNTATIDLDALANGSGTGGSGGSAYSYGNFFRSSMEGTTTATFANLVFGGYTIAAVTNITNTPGSAFGGNLSLNGLTVIRNTGGASEDDLTISLTATGYNLPQFQNSLDSNFGARLNAGSPVVPIIDFRSSYAVGNNAFGDDVHNIATTEGTNFGTGIGNEPFSAVASTSLNSATGTYSLTNVVTITGLGFGVNNRLDQGGESSVVTPLAVPAPAGLILMAGAVPFLALLRRRSRPADRAVEMAAAA